MAMAERVLDSRFSNGHSSLNDTPEWILGLKWSKEIIRYAIVGTVANVLGFLFYVLFTARGVSPVLTISILYPIQIGVAFFLNKKWSFKYTGRIATSAVRYLITYIGCYFLNVAVLKFFSSHLGYSHMVVQALAILVIALLLFLAQKYWVFRSHCAIQYIQAP